MITFVLLLRHLIETTLKKSTENFKSMACTMPSVQEQILPKYDILCGSVRFARHCGRIPGVTAVFFLSYGGFSKNTTQKKERIMRK